MPARRDTRIEASKVRRLSPLQPVEDQSQVWGIRCHSCTWWEGFAPSWQTELQGSSLPRGLPGSQRFLSTNGSHLYERGVDLAAKWSQNGIDGLQGAEHDAVAYADEAPPAHGLDDLRIEELRQWHPAGLGRWTFVVSTWELDPLPVVGKQRGQIVFEPIGEKQRDTAGRQHLHDLMDHTLRHGQRAVPAVEGEQQFGDRIERCPDPVG